MSTPQPRSCYFPPSEDSVPLTSSALTCGALQLLGQRCPTTPAFSALSRCELVVWLTLLKECLDCDLLSSFLKKPRPRVSNQPTLHGFDPRTSDMQSERLTSTLTTRTYFICTRLFGYDSYLDKDLDNDPTRVESSNTIIVLL